MDRRRSRVKYAITGAVLMAGLAACQSDRHANEPVTVEIAALKWLDDAADPIAHLTTQPATCVSVPEDPAVKRGALLFASPVLLGGQAAKAGLSCAACHRNGRGNPDFVFTGISGPPGTADVTHGLFSKIRADQVFNPVSIPDLATESGRTQVDRQLAGVLEAFLTAQIVEEFSGSVPEPQVVSDLAAYVRALDERACAADSFEPQSWQTEVSQLRSGLDEQVVNSGAHIGAMRAALGRLHNRFPAGEDAALRADLIAFSRSLASGEDFDGLRVRLDRLVPHLAAATERSFYHSDVLESALPQ
jgi:hypothetical protein